MFLPIGNEDAYIRRTPWVSAAIILLCVGVQVWSSSVEDERYERANALAEELYEYQRAHPYLVPPAEESPEVSRLCAVAREDSSWTHFAPIEPETLAIEQDILNTQARLLSDAVAALPSRMLGLVPAHPKPVSFLTSMFAHGGWFHLLSNLWFFFFLGLVLEDTYGPVVFALFYLASGLVAALTHVVAFPDSEIPLVGASGAIAGVMGAYMVRHGKDRIRMLWFILMRSGTFLAPAWALLGIWIVEQIYFALTTPAEVGGGIAYLAHVGGFAAGVGGAFLIRFKGWEGVSPRAAVNALDVLPKARGALGKAKELLATGDPAGALVAVKRAAERDPDSLPVAEVLWRAHEQLGAKDAAREAALRVLRGQLAAHNGPAALSAWRQIRASFGDERPPAERWRLIGLLTDREARPVLESLARDPRAGVLRDKAQARLDQAAHPGLGSGEEADPDAELLALLDAPLGEAPAKPRRPSRSHQAASRPPAGPSEASRPPAGPSGEAPVSPPPRAPAPRSPETAAPAAGLVQVHRARPARLEDQSLLFPDGRRLPFERVRRVVVAVVGSERRGALVDLVTTPPGASPAVVVRITSADVDAARLLGRPVGGAWEAFVALAGHLAARAGVPLEPQAGGPRAFPSVGAYEAATFGALPARGRPRRAVG